MTGAAPRAASAKRIDGTGVGVTGQRRGALCALAPDEDEGGFGITATLTTGGLRGEGRPRCGMLLLNGHCCCWMSLTARRVSL
jgi:hypothetical protein